MMTITSTHRGRTLKRVTFDHVEEHPCCLDCGDTQLSAAAMAATGETPSSLFGIHVEHHDNGTATVTLHTD
jgi:hypothetical protein